MQLWILRGQMGWKMTSLLSSNNTRLTTYQSVHVCFRSWNFLRVGDPRLGLRNSDFWSERCVVKHRSPTTITFDNVDKILLFFTCIILEYTCAYEYEPYPINLTITLVNRCNFSPIKLCTQEKNMWFTILWCVCLWQGGSHLCTYRQCTEALLLRKKMSLINNQFTLLRPTKKNV
jgi:hypothetical protein